MLARYVGGDAAVLSGLMKGADEIRQRPFAVDVPGGFTGKGRVVLFTNNPDLSVAEPRRVQHGLQRADELERSGGFAPASGHSAGRRGTAAVGLTSAARVTTTFRGSISDLQQRLAAQHYVADRGLAVSLFLALRLAGRCSSKAKPASARPRWPRPSPRRSSTDLIRLQCYEGLDVSHAVYEWDYARQLLELRILDAAGGVDRASARSSELYSDAFLIKRPLLQAIDPARTRPAVLLIDEIDRADEEFEGYLLELLAEFQITIPELGTVRAAAAAARHPDLEPHARGARCAQAPLPVSVDRLPGLREGAGHRPRARAARVGAAGGAGHRGRAGAARAGALQGARRVGNARLGGGAGRRSIATRSMPTRVDDTLGVAAEGEGRHRRDPRRAARRARRPRRVGDRAIAPT